MLWVKLVFVLLPLVYSVKAADDYIKWGSNQKPEDIKVINMSQDPSLPLDLSTLSATALPGSTVYVVLLNGNSEKPDVKTDEDSNTKVILITTPQPPTIPIEISPSYIELPAREEPTPIQKVVSPAPSEPIALIAPKPSTSWTTKRPQPVQKTLTPPPPTTEPALIIRREPTVESRPAPAPVKTSTPKVTKIVLPSKEPAKPKPVVKEPVIIPSKRKPITLPNNRPIPEEPKIIVSPKPEMSTKAPAIIVEPKPNPVQKPQPVQKTLTPPPPTTEPALIIRREPTVESRPTPAPVKTSTPKVTKIVLPSKEPAKPKPVVKEPVIIPSKRKPITLPNNRPIPEEPKIIVSPKPEMSTKAPAIIVEPKPNPSPATPVVVYHPPATSSAPPASKVVATQAPAKPIPTYIEQKPKPTPAPVAPTRAPSINSHPPSPTTLVPTQLIDYSCKDANGYYKVANECDTYVECKRHAASKFTCPEGLHFNPNAIWPEFPCGYPSEVQCEINALKQQPIPSLDCPHQYGYYTLADDCGKYVMCQEGRAIVMNCPSGLVFNDATSSCDWPENVPTCKSEVFGGFKCPTPPTDDYGELMDVIYKYRYGQSCREYVACQHGWPRLLSCDPGYSFDEDFQACVDSDYVQSCRL